MQLSELYMELACGSKLKLTHADVDMAKKINSTLRVYHHRHKAELELMEFPRELRITNPSKDKVTYEYQLVEVRPTILTSIVAFEVINDDT